MSCLLAGCLWFLVRDDLHVLLLLRRRQRRFALTGAVSLAVTFGPDGGVPVAVATLSNVRAHVRPRTRIRHRRTRRHRRQRRDLSRRPVAVRRQRIRHRHVRQHRVPGIRDRDRERRRPTNRHRLRLRVLHDRDRRRRHRRHRQRLTRTRPSRVIRITQIISLDTTCSPSARNQPTPPSTANPPSTPPSDPSPHPYNRSSRSGGRPRSRSDSAPKPASPPSDPRTPCHARPCPPPPS